MKSGKETKQNKPAQRDPDMLGFSYDEFFNNTLSLPDSLKNHLKEQNLDWRFLNAVQFRQAGNTHRSHWKPFKVPDGLDLGVATTPEGLVQRGDVVLGVRTKQISKAHKDFLKKRIDLQTKAGSNKQKARELRQMAQDSGLESVKVHEGYEEND